MMYFIDVVYVGATALLASGLSYRLLEWQSKKNLPPITRIEPETVFLFEGDRLIDTSDCAEQLLAMHHIEGRRWSDLRSVLAERFPNFPESAPQSATVLPMIIDSQDHGRASRIQIEQVRTRLRVSLIEHTEKDENTAERYQRRIWEGQVETLRNATHHAPYPIWQSDHAGRILWANTAYEDLITACGHTFESEDGSHTLPAVFDLPASPVLHRHRYRTSVTLNPGQEVLWYDVNSIREDRFTMHYAIDINAVVQGEAAQRTFVQTLTKTFAQLSIGLAIFDRKRVLTLFNPALTDLTHLPPGFLSNKPSLHSFFDQLRNAQIMPEPRSYAEWRDDLSDLANAAADGQYQETWSLPSGQTYRVSGRPHPDGAIAFLFEDVSAEVSLNRRFRTDMELNQAVLDLIPQPIALFSFQNTLQFRNQAYRDLWPDEPDVDDAEVSITNSLAHWCRHSQSGASFASLAEGLAHDGPISLDQASLRLTNGRSLRVMVDRLPGGAHMLWFSDAESRKPRLELVKTA